MSSRERTLLEEVLRELRAIAALDRTEDGFKDSAMSYAHALGRANGMALNAQFVLESLLGAKR